MSLKGLAERALHASGAMRVVRASKKNRCRILMYHGFAGPAEEIRARLEKQCEHLCQHYRPVSLSEIAGAVRSGGRLPENGLAITVDDGYRDLQLAFPIFRSFGLKVIVFVVSEFSGGDLWLWTDKVKRAFARTALRTAAVGLPSGEIINFTLETAEARKEAADAFEQAAMRLPNNGRLEAIGNLPQQLEVDLPGAAPPGFEALSWDDLRALSAQGLEIGAHTRTHPIVSRLENVDAIHDEIEGSKARIEEALRIKVRHFCYPNGRLQDFDERCVAAAREAGYETAVTTEAGLVKSGDDPYRLKRIGMDPGLSSLYFERRVAGLST